MPPIASEMRKFVAPEFVFGVGSAGLAGTYASNLGARKCLVVTDPHLIDTEAPAPVLDSLRAAGIPYSVFSGVSPNPKDREVMEGAAAYAREGCDCLVAVGGGSPMDCAKGIGIVSTNGRHILSFEGVDMVGRPGPPLICIPTTAGSAAEVSQFAIITHGAQRRKIAIVSKTVVPDTALVDPALTVSMDSRLTAATGMDTLTHAIEAYVSNASSPVTDLMALEAVRLVAGNLVRACEHPDDLAARSDMAQACLLAGLAFSNAILGAVHAMAHSLGGFLDLPHGECNAILLPAVVERNYSAAPERFDRIAAALGCDLDRRADVRRRTLVEALERLRSDVGIAGSLRAFGVRPEDLAALAENALADPCMVTNPCTLGREDIEALYGQFL